MAVFLHKKTSFLKIRLASIEAYTETQLRSQIVWSTHTSIGLLKAPYCLLKICNFPATNLPQLTIGFAEFWAPSSKTANLKNQQSKKAPIPKLEADFWAPFLRQDLLKTGCKKTDLRCWFLGAKNCSSKIHDGRPPSTWKETKKLIQTPLEKISKMLNFQITK